MAHKFNPRHEADQAVRAFTDGLEAWERPCGRAQRVRARGAVKTMGAVVRRRWRALPEGDEVLRLFEEGVDRWERPLRTHM
ncbi:MAG: hypothetical protein ABIN58_11825 [candidate division WOR-3 bacterium]